jgi:hypothetical protein
VTAPQVIVIRDPEQTLSFLAAACMALSYVSEPQTFPAFLAWIQEQAPLEVPENPDASSPLAFTQALDKLDEMFELLGGRS